MFKLKSDINPSIKKQDKYGISKISWNGKHNR